MHAKNRLPFLTTVELALDGIAYAQIQRPGVGPSSPDRRNQDLETAQQIRLLDEQRLLEEHRNGEVSARDQAIVQAQVAKFLEAIKHRKHRFHDFDQVVLHSKTPVTPAMLALMAESPYAADIAYYLGKHPEQSGAIAQIQPVEAPSAVQQLEVRFAAENAVRQ